MQEVLERLKVERKLTQDLLNSCEERRDRTPRGSASWRCLDAEAQFYKGEVKGLNTAIKAIEREAQK